MRYPSDLPTADRHELSAAFSSDDPLGYMDEQIAALTKIIDWGANEVTKWRAARAAAETFTPSAAPHEPSGEEVPRAAPRPLVDPTRPNGAGAARPRTRRSALTVLFDEQPGREWRTRDLANELVRRGWGGPSGNEANKVSRVLSLMVLEKEIESLRKGVYRLRTAQSDARPQTLEEASQ